MAPWLGSGHGIDPQVTPIYRKGNGAPTMGLLAAAAWSHFDDGDGHPNTPISIAARDADDILIVFCTGVGACPVPIEVGNWTAQLPSFGGSLVVYWRVATGDGDDAFTVPAAFGGMTSVQMASFFRPAGTTWAVEQSGTLTDNFHEDWIMGALGTTAEPNTLVIAFAMRTRAQSKSGLTVTDNTDMETAIGEVAQSPSNRTIWGFWSCRFDAASATGDSVECAYTPDEVDATQLMRYLRFKST